MLLFNPCSQEGGYQTGMHLIAGDLVGSRERMFPFQKGRYQTGMHLIGDLAGSQERMFLFQVGRYQTGMHLIGKLAESLELVFPGSHRCLRFVNY